MQDVAVALLASVQFTGISVNHAKIYAPCIEALLSFRIEIIIFDVCVHRQSSVDERHFGRVDGGRDQNALQTEIKNACAPRTVESS